MPVLLLVHYRRAMAVLRTVRAAAHSARGEMGGLGRSYRRSDTVIGCNSNYTFEELKHGCKISPDLPSPHIPFKSLSPSAAYGSTSPAVELPSPPGIGASPGKSAFTSTQ